MNKTKRIVVALLIVMALLGGYLIVAKNRRAAGISSADTPAGFLH